MAPILGAWDESVITYNTAMFNGNSVAGLQQDGLDVRTVSVRCNAKQLSMST